MREAQTSLQLRSPEMAAFLYEGIAAGTPLRQLCRELGVGKTTIYTWLDEDKALAGRIASARVRGYDELADQCLEIADDSTRDYVDTEHGEQLDRDHVQRSKLRIETRLKLLAKWDPKRYGEKTQLEHSGNVGSSTDPVQVMEQLVQMAATHPTQNPQIRKWLKECLSRIPPLEGGD